jgi:putative ABC transport system substrate-binding protein
MKLTLAALAGALALLIAQFAVVAQQTKVYRLGFLLQGSPPPPGRPPVTLIKALQDLGYVEGRSVLIERRWAEGKNERFPSLVAELIALNPDVIITDTTPGAIAAKRATATIPIVMTNVSDPVGSGIVASLARPGGNVTGVTDSGSDMAVKGVDLVHDVVPKATRIAVLMSDNPVHPAQLRDIQSGAKRIGLTVLPTMARSTEEFEEAFASMARKKAGALILLGGAPFSTERQRDKLVELAARTKLPTMYPGRWWVDAGGLLSYGPNALHRSRLVANYVDKILKGAKPSDLPVQQPSELELVINMKTAKALGLTIPPLLLLRANQVIE